MSSDRDLPPLLALSVASMTRRSTTFDLFDRPGVSARREAEPLTSGAVILRGFAAEDSPALLKAVETIAARAPFRHMVTPGGFRMSVAMTNSGEVGWVSDSRGYRYSPRDPTTDEPWPAMPAEFRRLAIGAARTGGFDHYQPDCCLINRYEPGARLSLHQDRDEQSTIAPIVSVSLGLPAIFLFGSAKRSDRPTRHLLESGDVVVWGGPARTAFHGVAPLADGWHSQTGRYRINLTFRRALRD